jgi:hypothetical protein
MAEAILPGRHRQPQRAVAREQALKRADGEDVPRLRHVGEHHHRDDEADQRPLDHDLAAEAIRQLAPQRRQHGRHRRRNPQADPGPERDVADVGEAELSEVERQERHHQREAGETYETGAGDCEQIPAPMRINRHQGRLPPRR